MITIESDLTVENGQSLWWFRWACTCGAAGSWLHDHAKVERMSGMHAMSHTHQDGAVQP